MDSIPKDRILEHTPNTILDIRKMYNLEKPGQMEEAVDILVEWIKKQNHFVQKNFSRSYLERTIILSKGSVERAKEKIDKICTMRTLMPKFYVNFDSKEDLLKMMSHNFSVTILPKFAEDYYRVCIFKFSKDSEVTSILDLYRYTVIVWEYIKAHDYLNGVIVVSDARDVNVTEFIKGLNLTEMREISTLVMNGFGLRVKGIHLITSSVAIELVVSLVKQFVSAKLGDRIVVHKTAESLKDHISKDILPEEYGGSERSFEKLQDDWLEVLGSKQHVQYMKEVKTFVTDEKCRQSDQFNDQYLGTPGTFKTLNVD